MIRFFTLRLLLRRYDAACQMLTIICYAAYFRYGAACRALRFSSLRYFSAHCLRCCHAAFALLIAELRMFFISLMISLRLLLRVSRYLMPAQYASCRQIQRHAAEADTQRQRRRCRAAMLPCRYYVDAMMLHELLLMRQNTTVFAMARHATLLMSCFLIY